MGQTPVKFVLLMVAAGLICGWAGMALWNMMSARLPVALSGQMIVFETIFSVCLLYTSAKNWARADEIRKELLEKNIVLEDAPGGVTTWRRA